MSSEDDATVRIGFTAEDIARMNRSRPYEAVKATEEFVAAQVRKRFGLMLLARKAAQLAGEGETMSFLGTEMRAVASGRGTAVGTAIAAALIAYHRLRYGKPLAGTGEAINRVILGDRDDRARALLKTRQYMESLDEAMIAVGRADVVTDDIASIGLNYYRRELIHERGLSKMREAFAADEMLDMLIERSASVVQASYNSVLKPALESFCNAMAQAPSAFAGGR